MAKHESVAAFADYLKVERGRGDATIDRYTWVIERFYAYLAKAATSVSIISAGKAEMLRFLRTVATGPQGLWRAAWNTHLSALRAFYDWLFKTEQVAVNPALKLDRYKVSPKEPVPLSLDEFMALLHALDDGPEALARRNVAIAHLFFHASLRVAEVVSLNLDQIDFDNGFLLNIRTKGNKRLSVPINNVVVDSLRDCLACRCRFQPSEAEGAVFLSRRRKRLSKRMVQRLIKRAAKKAGIDRPVGCHLLRHSSATIYAELGVALPIIRDQCGHESVSTTEHYIHLRDRARREAVVKLGEHVRQRLGERQGESPGAHAP